MAEDKCLGSGNKEWKSKFRPAGTATFKEESHIEIKKVSNQLKGKHKKTNVDLENLECDGTNISFDRLETRSDGTKVRVFYKNGVITGPTGGFFFINGTYEEVVQRADVVTQKAEPKKGRSGDEEGEGSGVVDSETGDWQAEKPVA